MQATQATGQASEGSTCTAQLTGRPSGATHLGSGSSGIACIWKVCKSRRYADRVAGEQSPRFCAAGTMAQEEGKVHRWQNCFNYASTSVLQVFTLHSSPAPQR